MENSCELLDNCAFFKRFKEDGEVIRQGWINLFCQSTDKSEWCVRKQINKKTGSPPPESMAPTGLMLPGKDLP
jgi:hypothetical protein